MKMADDQVARSSNLHYGLEVAKMSGLPDSLIAEAVDVAHHLDSQRVTSERAAKTKRAVRRVRTMLKVRRRGRLCL